MHVPKQVDPKFDECQTCDALPKTSALDIQVGGNHYKNFSIQPLEFSMRNNLNFIQGCIIKYTCRYNLPGGKKLEDLKKIIHYTNCLIEFEGYAE
jgi:hypothetical protein